MYTYIMNVELALFVRTDQHLPILTLKQCGLPNVKISIFFILFSSFFLSFFLLLSPSCIPQNYTVYVKYYTYRTTALLLKICLLWFRAKCELRLASNGLETVYNDGIAFSSGTSGGFFSRIPGVARMVRPHPDY